MEPKMCMYREMNKKSNKTKNSYTTRTNRTVRSKNYYENITKFAYKFNRKLYAVTNMHKIHCAFQHFFNLKIFSLFFANVLLIEKFQIKQKKKNVDYDTLLFSYFPCRNGNPLASGIKLHKFCI